MSKERIRELLKQLHKELKSTDADEETIALARELDADVRELLASSTPSGGAVSERMQTLEVQFSVRHPIAERILREIVDALAKMGI